MLSAWFTTTDFASKNATTIAKVSEALTASGQWAMANPGPAAAIFEKYTKVHLAHFGETFAKSLDPALLQPIFDSAARYKVISGPLNAKDVIWAAR